VQVQRLIVVEQARKALREALEGRQPSDAVGRPMGLGTWAWSGDSRLG
jgi:hypothetical protein